MIQYDITRTQSDLEQILKLQAANLLSNITKEEGKQEGFVTLVHDLDLLAELSVPYPHIIVKDGDLIIGYALVSTKEKASQIPLLKDTLDELAQLTFNGDPILNTRFFIMGQVCIDKQYRGRGIFKGLYQKMKKEMASDFDLIITEISTSNTRSMKAHEKIGFETLKIHEQQEENWAIVGWWIGKQKTEAD